ncbi:MAG: hypothetical protein CML46_08635 [Rhodobacteraceae bacterium]|nr:hypothetical protein [Paracoccaceae bacterium]MBR26990.1 hypothetical protein [Paracoccaceae bacterium]
MRSMVGILKRTLHGALIFSVAVGVSPEGLMRLSLSVDTAEALGGGRGGGGGKGGFSRGGGGGRQMGGGARTRPTAKPSISRPSASRPSIAAARPGGKPGGILSRPSGDRPAAARPGAGKPAGIGGGDRPGADRPSGSRPSGDRPGGDRPAGIRPGGDRPGGDRPGGNVNIGNTVNIGNNVGTRPGRPPGAGRPAYNRPGGWYRPVPRPPGWRPRPYPPPYVRPPHARWGDYYYNPGWGWFFTGAIAGATIAYVASLPEDEDCDQATENGDTVYICNGVVYRSTYYQDEKVYEIVSEEDPKAPPEPKTVVGLSLTTPLTQGGAVRTLQNKLVELGYDVGGVDGVYGDGTANAVEWYQYDNDLEATGVVDQATADKMGL